MSYFKDKISNEPVDNDQDELTRLPQLQQQIKLNKQQSQNNQHIEIDHSQTQSQQFIKQPPNRLQCFIILMLVLILLLKGGSYFWSNHHKYKKCQLLLQAVKNKLIQRKEPMISNVYENQNIQDTKTENLVNFKSKQNYQSNETISKDGQITNLQKIKAGKWLHLVQQNLQESSQLSQSQLTYYQQKYQISQYKQQSFCIVVPTYNNADSTQRWRNNIRSIIMQNYTNYHIVVIDDASTDETGMLIKQHLNNQTKIPPQRYRVIFNQKRNFALPNLRRAATEFCRINDIFMIVDGDDELIGKQVLKIFNSQFQFKNAWFLYSNYIQNTGSIGNSREFPLRIIQQNTYRNYPFVTSHLRAYYTKLFLNIKEQDLKNDQGDYFKAANDVAICIPILEQAHTHVAYIPELTYFYNSNTGNNNHVIRLKDQKVNDRIVRGKPAYQELAKIDLQI